MAIIDAMMSFVKDRGDALQCIRCWPNLSQPFLAFLYRAMLLHARAEPLT